MGYLTQTIGLMSIECGFKPSKVIVYALHCGGCWQLHYYNNGQYTGQQTNSDRSTWGGIYDNGFRLNIGTENANLGMLYLACK